MDVLNKLTNSILIKENPMMSFEYQLLLSLKKIAIKNRSILERFNHLINKINTYHDKKVLILLSSVKKVKNFVGSKTYLQKMLPIANKSRHCHFKLAEKFRLEGDLKNSIYHHNMAASLGEKRSSFILAKYYEIIDRDLYTTFIKKAAEKGSLEAVLDLRGKIPEQELNNYLVKSEPKKFRCAEYYFLLGMYYKTRDVKQMLIYFNLAGEMRNSNAYIQLGLFHKSRNEIDLMFQAFNKAIFMYNSQGYVELARVSNLIKYFDRIHLLEIACEQKNIEAAKLLAEYYLNLGNTQKSIRYYQLALSFKLSSY